MTIKRIRRMCQRIGCTKTWAAKPTDTKRYCRECIPQSSSGPKYPFRMQKQCACGAKEIKEIHSEQERAAPFECKSCTDASTNYKWHEMQLLYLVMLNDDFPANEFVRQGVFESKEEYCAFRSFVKEVMQIDLDWTNTHPGYKPIKRRKPTWSWGTLADNHTVIKRSPVPVPSGSAIGTVAPDCTVAPDFLHKVQLYDARRRDEE